MDTTTRDRSRARIEIVFGYGVSALGALIDLISWIARDTLRLSARFDVNSFASAFGFFATVAAWWFLAQVVAESTAPRQLVRRALAALILGELFVAISQLSFIGLFQHLQFDWPVAGNGLIGLGALFSAVGFCSMLVTFRDRYAMRGPIDAPSLDKS
jgi:hypothetical protein